MATSGSPSTHQFLRESTASLHDAVEAASPLKKISAGTLKTASEYTELLQDIYEVLRELEPLAESTVIGCRSFKSLDLNTDTLAQGHFLSRRDLAAADLNALGAEPRDVRPELRDLAHRLSDASPATRFGLAYVLMGQSLGAAMLHRSLMSRNSSLVEALRPRLDPANSPEAETRPPFSFFAGHGKSSARYWSLFLSLLEAEIPAGLGIESRDALQGALLGFEAFGIVWRQSRP